MFSKISFYELSPKLKQHFNFKKNNLQAIVCDDAFLEIIFRNKLKNLVREDSNKEGEKISFRMFSGDEITKNLIEDSFLNLSFFSTNDPVIVINADSMNDEVLELINKENISETYMIFFFKSIKKNLEKALLNSQFQLTEVLSAKFWEGQKLLVFLLQENNINSSSEWQKLILENVEHTTEALSHFINSAKNELGFDWTKSSPRDFFSHFERERYDQFELINLFHQNYAKFLETLELKALDFEWLLTFSMFMQSHLVKVLYPQEIAAKEKPNKYEISILQISESQNKNIIKNGLTFFSKLEIMSKNRDVFTLDFIRLKKLETINF